MPKSKSKDEPQLTAQELLEARVTAMMEPDSPAGTETAPKVADNQPVGPPALPGKPTAKPPKETPAVPSEPQTEPQPTPVAELVADPPAEAITEPVDIEIKPLNLDTPQTDAAIADIVAQEADEVLAAEDAGLATAQLDAEAEVEQPPARHGHPIFWFLILLMAILSLIFAALLLSPSLSFAP